LVGRLTPFVDETSRFRFVAPSLAGAVATCILLVRPWLLRWRAKDEECDELLSGEELVNNPTSLQLAPSP
jgi:hypothetical protein